MDNLIKLKECIFRNKPSSDAIELCYKDFLDDFEPANAHIFLNLLEMTEKTPRMQEILKVFNFVKFPVKKTIN